MDESRLFKSGSDRIPIRNTALMIIYQLPPTLRHRPRSGPRRPCWGRRRARRWSSPSVALRPPRQSQSRCRHTCQTATRDNC